MRLSGIYGEGRLYLVSTAKDLAKWPQENHWSNRIHRDDAAAFMVFLVTQALAGKALAPCYIVTDAKPTPQYEVLQWIATKLNVEAQVATPVIEGGKRLSNQTMLATGFKLQYPDFKAGYQSLLNEVSMQESLLPHGE